MRHGVPFGCPRTEHSKMAALCDGSRRPTTWPVGAKVQLLFVLGGVLVNAAFVSAWHIYNPFLAFTTTSPTKQLTRVPLSCLSPAILSLSVLRSSSHAKFVCAVNENPRQHTSQHRRHVTVQASETQQEFTQIAFGVRECAYRSPSGVRCSPFCLPAGLQNNAGGAATRVESPFMAWAEH